MAKQSELGQVSEQLNAEIDRDAAILGPELFGSLPDAKELSKPEFLSVVRQHWADPLYRQALRTRHGDEGLVEIYKALKREEVPNGTV